jgi:hypothetical protein
MEKILDKLRAVCFKLAGNTMWELKPVDADRIKAHAERICTDARKLISAYPNPENIRYQTERQ